MILRAFTDKDLPKIRALYREAFPLIERAPFALLKKRAKEGRATMLVAVDRGAFCGFFMCWTIVSLPMSFILP